MIGSSLAHFKITAKLGEGGMGEVYRATDLRLGREVALKVLPHKVAGDPERLERFTREAQVVAALNHPNIVTIHSVEEADGLHLLTMELVEGQSLAELLPPAGLERDRLLPLAIQIADALEAAHAHGVTHRDLKPANVMVTDDGRIKILDFGLAKQVGAAVADDAETELMTQAGVILGTVPYMSPEQVQGQTVDHRSDLFSFGILLYEMATGRRPFQGDDPASVMASILKDEPDFGIGVAADLPAAIATLIERCLMKDPARRPAHAGEVRGALQAHKQSVAEKSQVFRNPLVRVGVAAIVVLLIALGWALVRRNQALAFQAEALPRISELAREQRYVEAFELAREVEGMAGAGAVSEMVWERISRKVSVTSEPSTARITVAPVGVDRPPWSLGPAPLTDIRVPKGPMHWRAESEGRLPAEFVSIYPPSATFVLRPEDEPDADMVRVPSGNARVLVLGGLRAARSVSLTAYLIDRHEVTNREYAAFVEAGGYETEEYWHQPFREGDRPFTFDEAMERFRDATGRPGPAGWRLGSFPDGQGDLPVSGVSWYEAAAYAVFAGKELPTIYHWYHADLAGDRQHLPGLFLPESNFESDGPRAAGPDCVLGSYGAHEMAGNLREWSATAVGTDRLALGGSWADPSYVYMIPDVRSPLDRSPANGFRCIRRLDNGEPSSLALAPIERSDQRDYLRETPVSGEMYATLLRFYEKEPVPLDPRIELTDDSAEHWIKQKVSYAAGYGGERMLAWLYMPRNTAPPYQTIVQMSGAGTFYRRSSDSDASIFGWERAENLVRGGRAVLLPLWKGSYERSDGFHPFEASAAIYREHTIQWVSELRRSVDYLESRDDIDARRIGFQGLSFGAMYTPLFMALEPRLRAGLIIGGGFLVMDLGFGRFPPEIDPLNFAPRVSAPVLMLSGRHDPIFPYETSQLPLYRTLGTPAEDKRHITFPSGHLTLGWGDDLIRESLDWLDRCFGKPTRAAN